MRQNTPELHKELNALKKQLAQLEEDVNQLRIRKGLQGVDGNAGQKLHYNLLYAAAYLKTAGQNIDEGLQALKERETYE